MTELRTTNEPEVLEIVIRQNELVLVAYVRENSVTLVRERDGKVLEYATFGSGPLQVLRDWMKGER
jgi:phosphosulfolactate phosphohydrolase-like enzyme